MRKLSHLPSPFLQNNPNFQLIPPPDTFLHPFIGESFQLIIPMSHNRQLFRLLVAGVLFIPIVNAFL